VGFSKNKKPDTIPQISSKFRRAEKIFNKSHISLELKAEDEKVKKCPC